jgi:predicted secreted protein
MFQAMLRPAPYLSQKLTRPIPTKDGGTLHTVLDARTYMLRLSKNRERRGQWQRAAELLLEEADVAALSKQVELALFMDAKLDVTKVSAKLPTA